MNEGRREGGMEEGRGERDRKREEEEEWIITERGSE